MSLPMDATKEDIKKQYRRLCLQWHPDKSDGGRERFEQLQVAHRFLTDDAQREEYDFGIWTDRPARHHTKKRDKVKDSWNDKNSTEEDAPRNHYNWGDRHLIEDERWRAFIGVKRVALPGCVRRDWSISGNSLEKTTLCLDAPHRPSSLFHRRARQAATKTRAAVPTDGCHSRCLIP